MGWLPDWTPYTFLANYYSFGGIITVQYKELDGFGEGSYGDDVTGGLQVLGGGAYLVNKEDIDKVKWISVLPGGHSLVVLVYPSPGSTWDTLDVQVQGTAAAVITVQAV